MRSEPRDGPVPEAPPGMRVGARSALQLAVAPDDPQRAAAELRETLARALGERPRRLGSFAQLALAGALACRDAAILVPEETALLLTSDTAVWLDLAPRVAAFNASATAPSPFEFLGVQANAACLTIARRLGLAGPALFLSVDAQHLGAAVAALAQDAPALLLGQVEFGSDAWSSIWTLFVAA